MSMARFRRSGLSAQGSGHSLSQTFSIEPVGAQDLGILAANRKVGKAEAFHQRRRLQTKLADGGCDHAALATLQEMIVEGEGGALAFDRLA
jgi:hypothetical protein